MRASLLWGGIGAAVVAAAALVFSPGSETEAADVVEETAPDRTSRDPRVDRLASRVEELELALSRRSPASGSAAAATQEAAPVDDEERRRALREEAARQEAEASAALNHQHLGEEREVGWSTETETAALTALASESFAGTRVTDVDCRTTLCRLRVDHDDGDSFDRFVDQLGGTPPFDTQGMIFRDGPDESAPSVVYFARPGERLELPGTGAE